MEPSHFQWRTPLHYALRDGQNEVIKYLIKKYHADIEVMDDIGSTPLEQYWKNYFIVLSLLNYIKYW